MNKINRRTFAIQTALTVASLSTQTGSASTNGYPIRLGGPVQEKYESPEQWIAILQRLGYSAAYCPVNYKQSDAVVRAYEKAARDANIIIAEVGAWSNPMDPDENKRKAAWEKCIHQLALADRIGAHCCVNICGSVGEKWDGHHPLNLTEETFDRIVETTRSIIDAVKPTRTYYTLETMPWAYPDSPDAYVRLLKAMDRKRFAAHLDPVNIITSPQRYYSTGAIIRECFEKFGQYIRSCHAKDIILQQKLTTHLDETRPGLGNLDYAVFLKELSQLDNIPLMLEHLKTAQEYQQAADYIRNVGRENHLQFG